MIRLRGAVVAVVVAAFGCGGPAGMDGGSGGGAMGGGEATGGGTAGGGTGGGTAGGGGGTTGGGGGTVLPTSSDSTVTVDRSDNVIADGTDRVDITVTIRGAGAVPVAGVAVTVTASGSSNTLTPAGITDANGVTHATLKSTRAETKTITARFTTVQGDINIVQQPTARFVGGPAVRLTFQTSPGASVAGASLAPSPAVVAEDANGNLTSAMVTVTLSGGTPGATLAGPATTATLGGVATFAALAIDRAGTGYRLDATASGAMPASSTAFDVTAASPSVLSFEAQPTSGVAGDVLSPTVIGVRDSFGNLTSSSSLLVTVREPDGGSVLGTLSVTADGGLASFVDLALTFAGPHVLEATAPALTSATSQPIVIVASQPSALFSSLEPTPLTLLGDGMATTTLVLTVRDGFQNPVGSVAAVLDGVADGGGLVITQPSTPTDDAGVTSGLAACSVAQTVTFTATLIDGGALATSMPVRFTCVPMATSSCYTGPVATENVGLCLSGTRTCDGTGTWGPCVGEVLPAAEVCADGMDQDCNGIADDSLDADGDGWAVCDNDCCDSTTGCASPAAVNPGAFEVVGNGVDDDCEPGTIDTAPAATCSTTQTLTGVTPSLFARAMDLCQATTANPPISQRRWGLVSSQHVNADGSSPGSGGLTQMQNSQTSVLQNFGMLAPRKGSTLAMLSTGVARDSNDPGFVAPNAGTNFGRVMGFPSSPLGPLGRYLGQHGGSLVPGSCAGMFCVPGSNAYDAIIVRLTIRVPTNALGFSYDFRFFSAEYQSYQCMQFNDSFLPLVTSSSPSIPSDRQVSFDSLGQPISVNSAFLQACPGNFRNCRPCPLGTSALVGTGYDISNTGGATPWLTTDVPVIPGETITIDFLLMDVADPTLDSAVLFDNFRWSAVPVTLSTHE